MAYFLRKPVPQEAEKQFFVNNFLLNGHVYSLFFISVNNIMAQDIAFLIIEFISWFVAVWLDVCKTGNVLLVIFSLFYGLFIFFVCFSKIFI